MVLYAPLKALHAPGAVRFAGALAVSTAGTLNDWQPTGIDSVFEVRITPTAAITLTGMAAALDGTMRLISHVGATDFPINLSHANSGSTVKLANGRYKNQRLFSGDQALYRYQASTSTWRLLSIVNDALDQSRRLGAATRTEAAWWKVYGSCSRQRRGMQEAESVDGTTFLSVDDASGPLMRLSTNTTPYVAGGTALELAGACGIRTGPRLFQRRWDVRAFWDRVSIPTSLATTRSWWGCFSEFETYGLSSVSAIHSAAFRFQSTTHATLLYSVTSDGSSTTAKQLANSTPQSQHEYEIQMDASEVRFYEDGALISTHGSGENLPDSSTMLGHSVSTELLSGGSTIRSVTWARSGYSHG